MKSRCRVTASHPGALLSHANAALTPRTRLRLARLIVDDGWTCAAAAKMFMVAPRTARKWAERYRVEGVAGMADRSSRPTAARRAPRTSWCQDRAAAVAAPAWAGPDRGPARPAGPDGPRGAGPVPDQPARAIDRVTGEPLRRYEHAYPGSMIHVDVTKFGNIPDGGGHRFVGRRQGDLNSSDRPSAPASASIYKPRHRHRVPAHRDRRPLPGRLRRDLHR